MIILKTYPPNIDKIDKKFGVKDKHGVVYTYGGCIFNPDDCPIDEPLSFHEATHSLQQDKFKNSEAWWDKYLKDPQFRLKEEVEAYKNQFRRYCELQNDRNKRAIFLNRIAMDLSSSQYGGIISLIEARKLIGDFVYKIIGC